MTETNHLSMKEISFGQTYMPELLTEKPLLSSSNEPELYSLNSKIKEQNKKLVQSSCEHQEEIEKLNTELDKAISNLEENLSRLKEVEPHRQDNPLAVGLEHKIAEFKRVTEANNEKIKKNLDTLPEIQRKKKENDDFFKKFNGEKKVWLDRLKETELRKDAYESGFKYFYEAKTFKLILEGIMLEKVQDAIDKELTVKGFSFGYEVMDEQKLNEKRKQEEFDFYSSQLNMDHDTAMRQEKEQKEKWEREDKDNAAKREKVYSEWKQLWRELWLPGVSISTDQTMCSKRALMKKVTMDVTFNMFKNLCFDVWKFKNIINSADEYVILDKVRRFFPENPNKPNKDEAILDILMDMIENIKQEEEIIYCDLKPAKEKLAEYMRSTGDKANVNASIDRLKLIISKIESVQAALKRDSTNLVKSSVEEIKALIKAIPDDHEKKLFKDNLHDEDRLYDRYLPLTNLLMVVSFISIGKKRNKGYQDKIDKIMKENEKIKMENKEIEGKLNLLYEVKEKVKNEQVFEVKSPGFDGDYEKEYEECKRAKNLIVTEIDRIKENKDMIKSENEEYLNEISKCVVIPYKIDERSEPIQLNQINPTIPENVNNNIQ